MIRIGIVLVLAFSAAIQADKVVVKKSGTDVVSHDGYDGSSDYPNNYKRKIMIKAKGKNMEIELVKKAFDLEEAGSRCKDKLVVEERVGKKWQQVGGEHCGSDFPDKLRIEAKRARLSFKSDGARAATGFKITVNFVKEGGNPDPSPAPSGKCGNPTVPIQGGRIVGGVEAKRGQFPWHVNMMLSYGRQWCGGSILSSKWVLTAKHCLTNWADRVMAGDYDNTVTDETEQTVYIKRQIPHSGSHDIALLELDGEFELKPESCWPVCLRNTPPANEEKCWVSGFGALHSGHGGQDGPLMYVAVTMWDHQVCMDEFNYINGQVAPTEICAGEREGGKDSCQGDSGGALVCRNGDNSYYNAGIVSWGQGCAWEGWPGVYVNTPKFIDWICEQTNGEVCSE